MITLYFVRHGQTVWNESGRYQGSTEVALSALGKEQAKLTAHWFEGIFLNGIISSSLGRAMETAKEIAKLKNMNVEVVDALQQLTRLAVQQKTGERSHLIVDVDGFLKRKRQHLRDVALDAIDAVKESGEPMDLKPMNSFERKVVHDVVRDEGLKSRSHGEEPHRYVTVYLRNKNEDNVEEEEVDDQE